MTALGSGSVQWRSVIEALEHELRDMGRVGAELQAALSPQRVHGNDGLQALDLLTQRLCALGGFLAALTPAIDPGCRVDMRPALATISLSDVARRLSAGPADARAWPPADPAVAGVLDLF